MKKLERMTLGDISELIDRWSEKVERLGEGKIKTTISNKINISTPVGEKTINLNRGIKGVFFKEHFLEIIDKELRKDGLYFSEVEYQRFFQHKMKGEFYREK
jgi:hypothetical protein